MFLASRKTDFYSVVMMGNRLIVIDNGNLRLRDTGKQPILQKWVANAIQKTLQQQNDNTNNVVIQLPKGRPSREDIISYLNSVAQNGKFGGVVTDSPDLLMLLSEDHIFIQKLFGCNWFDLQIALILLKGKKVETLSPAAFDLVRGASTYIPATDGRRNNKGSLEAGAQSNAIRSIKNKADLNALRLLPNILKFIQSSDPNVSLNDLAENLSSSGQKIIARQVTRFYKYYQRIIIEDEHSDFEELAQYQLLRGNWKLISDFFASRQRK